MKKIVIILLFVVISSPIYANLRYINFSAIPDLDEYEEDVLQILNNEYYMDTYIYNWNYDLSKSDFADGVEAIFERLEAHFNNHSNNLDLCLFLGEISRFLYNLEKHDYYSSATKYFELARGIDPHDYRADWFEGFFLVQAARIIEGIELIKPIANQLRDHLPPYFWTDYSIATYSAMMHWTSYDAYNQFKTFNTDDFEGLDSIFTELESKIIKPKNYETYEANQVWKRVQSTNYFLSNMISMRILDKEEWEISFQGFKNSSTVVIAKPERYDGYHNQQVGSTIISLISTKQGNNTLEKHLNNFIQDNFEVESVELDLPFENSIVYEITDNTKYKEQGGGRFILIGFEKTYNKKSLVDLEMPGMFSSTEDGRFYHFDKLYDRFDENLFYVFMLDSCRAIYEPSKIDFIDFIKNNVKIK